MSLLSSDESKLFIGCCLRSIGLGAFEYDVIKSHGVYGEDLYLSLKINNNSGNSLRSKESIIQFFEMIQDEIFQTSSVRSEIKSRDTRIAELEKELEELKNKTIDKYVETLENDNGSGSNNG